MNLEEPVGLEGNRLEIRLGGPYFTVFLVNGMTIDLQNRQMGLAGMGGFLPTSQKTAHSSPPN